MSNEQIAMIRTAFPVVVGYVIVAAVIAYMQIDIGALEQVLSLIGGFALKGGLLTAERNGGERMARVAGAMQGVAKPPSYDGAKGDG